ncbi:trk system potassium uptake protein TrkH [Geomicrobium halophilum]|uniref:Trk system potassium uptake protein TrkH n=1 Tax=Geomicrobium halophilum TaxID=549000 RepID=A0A841PN09_9BACL|nr:potassium transporter TrkG [Geomicrobium halophilum]MBB6450237.1 trk system potassium uptake protein TrkH [Geomicrobium halophilum]
MAMLKKTLHVNPPQWIVLGFVVLIFIGTILLALPQASADGESVGFLDALFMAVSAVCVTGLAVLESGTDFSMFGQIVMIILVQLGGLGFMIFGVSVAVLVGKVMGLKYRLLLQSTTNTFSARGLIRLAMIMLGMALLLEAIVTLILTIHWSSEQPWTQAAYSAFFHSVMAFNNAGFSLYANSMEDYIGDPVVNLSLSVLFIVGGLGFMVLVDLYRKRSLRELSLHSKLSLVTSGGLLVVGFLFLLIVELFNPATEGLLISERLLSAYFQSATPRSGGFNTFDIGSMLVASQFFIIVLMFIGASTGGTGGGIKTNTFAILVLATINTFRSGQQVHAFNRKIAIETVMRALAVVVSSLVWIVGTTLLLSITEDIHDVHFLTVLFEAVSAFSTTGLSMGLTEELSPAGKIITIITMFVGRLGPLTLAYALTYQQKPSKISYPEDKVLIG